MTDHTDGHQENTDMLEPASNEPRNTPSLVEKFVIRLPKGLRNKIKHLSEQNRRSMNSEIIMVLEKHIQQHLTADAHEFAIDAGAMVDHGANGTGNGTQKLSDSELSRRLENLPEEKKQALLELLG